MSEVFMAPHGTINEAERCANTIRPLTRSTSTQPKEGLPMNGTRSKHPQWHGSPQQYQIHARILLEDAYDRTIHPWAWITNECQTGMCLALRDMRIHQPLKINYPLGACVYCGNPPRTRDHLLPKPWTGQALRGMVPVVPACKSCNSRIGDFPSPNVGARRRVAQLSVQRTNRALIDRANIPDTREMGHILREAAKRREAKRQSVLARLTWPDDPFYDLRAFQKSGIDDPILLGLCNEYSEPLIEEMGNQ